MPAWYTKQHANGASRWYMMGTVGDPEWRMRWGGTHDDLVFGAIRGIKRMLNAWGHGPISTEKGFGPSTAEAVRRCQRAFGLTVDGVFGKATARALFSDAIAKAEEQFGIPDRLILRTMLLESELDPGAYGANETDIGIAQFNLAAHPQLGLPQATDPHFSIPLAADWHDRAYRDFLPRMERLARDLAVGDHNSPRSADWRAQAALGVPPGVEAIKTDQSLADRVFRIKQNAEYVALVRSRA